MRCFLNNKGVLSRTWPSAPTFGTQKSALEVMDTGLARAAPLRAFRKSAVESSIQSSS